MDYVNIVNTTSVRDLIFIDDGLISVMVVEKGVDYLLTGLKRVSVSRESGIEISKLEPRGINARLKRIVKRFDGIQDDTLCFIFKKELPFGHHMCLLK